MFMRELATFLPKLFYFFLESISQIGESEHRLGPIAFRKQTVNWGMTPYLSSGTTFSQAYIARVGSNEIGLILTRISASFGAATREMSQNGNWIRVMSFMESFERPASRVPDDALTIISTSSDNPSTHKRNVQTSLAINSPCADGMG